MKDRITKIVWGGMWVTLGVILALSALGVVHISEFFDGWWTLFLIIPSVIFILCKGFNVLPTICLTVGILLLLEFQRITITPLMAELIVPVVLIVIGLNIVIRNLLNPCHAVSQRGTKPTEYAVTFSSNKMVYPSQSYSGSELNAIFGSLTLDLRNAIIQEDVVIDCTAVFGGIDIYLPDHVKVRECANALFGGVDNKLRGHIKENGPVVYLNGIVLFGGVTIR